MPRTPTPHAICLATFVTSALMIIDLGPGAWAASWSAPVPVRQGSTDCVSYRAKLSGEWLVVEVTHEPGWHTYAMDNERRAQEKLAGKKSLGLEQPTTIRVLGGLQLAGPWYQSKPEDYSKPDLRWFTWGFEGTALFAARVSVSDNGTPRIAVQGQTCNEASCHLVDIEIPLPRDGAEAPVEIDIKKLVRVRMSTEPE